jgi:predicted hotdog family 3-hydroxylacyl-ACP dehydratase
MKATIVVPAAGGYFEGHFPGRPILPAVAQLVLALRALAQVRGRESRLRAIAFARMRQLVLPGDRLEFSARVLDGERVRIDVHRGEALVSNAELILGAADAPGEAATGRTPVDPALSAAPPLHALLPHRPPMRLVTSLVRETDDGLTCTACVSRECPLAQQGRASVLAAVEAAAQTAAAWEALRRWREGTGTAPRIGYLVALRDIALFAEDIPVEAEMLASVRLEAAAPPLAHYRVEVSIDARLLVRGIIASYLQA